MAQTPLNVQAVLKEIYEPSYQYEYNARTPILAAISREGRDLNQESREHFFAIKTAPGQTARFYGQDDPYEFETCDAPPGYQRVCLKYKVTYIPYEWTNQLLHEATPAGAMFDVYKADLEDMADQHASQMERLFLTGDGRDVLFALDGTEVANADGSFTYGIQWYAGDSGEDLGVIVENLNLCGLDIQAASACDVVARNINPVSIVAIDATYGAETITVDAQIPGATAGDIVFRSRAGDGSIQGCDDAPYGLPVLIDDFTAREEFQCLTADECNEFTARIMHNSGARRDLDENLLSQAVTLAKVRAAGKRKGSMQIKHAFTCHPFTSRRFANAAMTPDRRITAPALWGKKGIRPVAGVEIDALTFDGIPFLESQLAFLNRTDLIDLSQIVKIHNGAAEGQFLVNKDGDSIRDVPCSPRSQIALWAFVNFGIRSRKSSVSIRDLNSFQL